MGPSRGSLFSPSLSASRTVSKSGASGSASVTEASLAGVRALGVPVVLVSTVSASLRTACGRRPPWLPIIPLRSQGAQPADLEAPEPLPGPGALSLGSLFRLMSGVDHQLVKHIPSSLGLSLYEMDDPDRWVCLGRYVHHRRDLPHYCSSGDGSLHQMVFPYIPDSFPEARVFSDYRQKNLTMATTELLPPPMCFRHIRPLFLSRQR